MGDKVDLLRSVGLKATKARVGVLGVLSEQKRPSDVGEILEGLDEKKIQADQATVYRVLESLEQVGIVKTVNFEEGKLRYELADDHHHHLVCTNCKRVEPFGECVVDGLGEKIRQTHRFQVTKHSLEFFGVCSRCQRN